MSTRPKRVKVLFIGGSGRCGSTLLDLMFGQVDGVCSVGELQHIWVRGLSGNMLCGCSQPFLECGFWRSVVREAFGRVNDVDVDRVLENKRSVDRTRFVPALAAPRLRSRRFENSLQEYRSLFDRLYGAIQTVTGCKVICDSSKVPSYGYILSQSDAVDLTVVHLIRDSRAVAYSWKKKVVRPEIHWTTQHMPRYSVGNSTLKWIVINAMIERLGRRATNYIRVRYENLARSPRETFSTMMSSAGIGGDEPDFLEDGVATFDKTHTVSGNPMRFANGPVELRPDLEWTNSLPFVEKTLVTLCTAYQLKRYGYRLSWKP